MPVEAYKSAVRPGVVIYAVKPLPRAHIAAVHQQDSSYILRVNAGQVILEKSFLSGNNMHHKTVASSFAYGAGWISNQPVVSIDIDEGSPAEIYANMLASLRTGLQDDFKAILADS